MKGERGSVTFFVVAVMLPLMFFLFSLSLDLVKFYAERERVQQVMDRAVMFGVLSLPYRELAENRVREYLHSNLQIDPVQLQLSTSSDAILAISEHASNLSFPEYFGVNIVLPYSVASRGRLSPLDLFLAIDSGGHLAPQPGVLWGDPTLWPASLVFNFVNTPPDAYVLDGKRYFTQKCHNPAFTTVKQAAVRIFDYLGSVRLNSAGVGFFPHDLGPAYVFESRDVRPTGFESPSVGYSAEAILSNFSALETFDNIGYLYSDASCAAILDQETALQYQLPPINSAFSSPSIYPGVKLANNLAQLGAGYWELNQSYAPYLSAREAIWSRSVRSGAGDISAVLANALSELQSAQFVDEREGLALSARRAVIVLLGDLPYQGNQRFPDGTTVNALTSGLSAFDLNPSLNSSEDIEAYFVILKHEGNTPDFDARLAVLQSTLVPWPKAHIISESDTDLLVSSLVDALGLIERRVAISK